MIIAVLSLNFKRKTKLMKTNMTDRMTDLKMSVGGSKPSGFSVKDILDLPNVKTTSSSAETISSLPATGMSLYFKCL